MKTSVCPSFEMSLAPPRPASLTRAQVRRLEPTRASTLPAFLKRLSWIVALVLGGGSLVAAVCSVSQRRCNVVSMTTDYGLAEAPTTATMVDVLGQAGDHGTTTRRRQTDHHGTSNNTLSQILSAIVPSGSCIKEGEERERRRR